MEFFQKKVQPIPDKSAQTAELERQTASLLQDKVEEAYDEAVRNVVTNSVVRPLWEAKVLVEPLVISLGPPLKPWTGISADLADKLNHSVADFNKTLEKARENNKKVEGKAIEGTGFFSLGYVSYVGIFIGGILLIWFGVKVYGVFNPAVAVGQRIVKGIGSKVAAAGFGQVVNGIESLKTHLKTSDQAAYSVDDILELIREHQERKQDTKIQEVVKDITKT